jgi:hypothetical protein
MTTPESETIPRLRQKQARRCGERGAPMGSCGRPGRLDPCSRAVKVIDCQARICIHRSRNTVLTLITPGKVQQAGLDARTPLLCQLDSVRSATQREHHQPPTESDRRF